MLHIIIVVGVVIKEFQAVIKLSISVIQNFRTASHFFSKFYEYNFKSSCIDKSYCYKNALTGVPNKTSIHVLLDVSPWSRS